MQGCARSLALLLALPALAASAGMDSPELKAVEGVSKQGVEVFAGMLEAFLHRGHATAAEVHCMSLSVKNVTHMAFRASADVAAALSSLMSPTGTLAAAAAATADLLLLLPQLEESLGGLLDLFGSFLGPCVGGASRDALQAASRHLANLTYVSGRLQANGADIVRELADAGEAFEEGRFGRFGQSMGTACRKVLLSKNSSPQLPEGAPSAAAVANLTAGVLRGFFGKGLELDITSGGRHESVRPEASVDFQSFAASPAPRAACDLARLDLPKNRNRVGSRPSKGRPGSCASVGGQALIGTSNGAGTCVRAPVDSERAFEARALYCRTADPSWLHVLLLSTSHPRRPADAPRPEYARELQSGIFEPEVVSDAEEPPRVNLRIDLHQCVKANLRALQPALLETLEYFARQDLASEDEPEEALPDLLAAVTEDGPAAMSRCGLGEEELEMLGAALEALGSVRVKLRLPRASAGRAAVAGPVADLQRAAGDWKALDWFALGEDFGRMLLQLVVQAFPQKYSLGPAGSLGKRLGGPAAAAEPGLLGAVSLLLLGLAGARSWRVLAARCGREPPRDLEQGPEGAVE